MIKSVRNNASPISTWFGGAVCVPMAVLKKCSTMIIGRNKEQQELRDAYHSDESKFVAVYGRRRVGKTYLVRQTFKESLTFSYALSLINEYASDES